ncbi:TetR/AcrR family transcriptional regulator [Streptacidiphilus cavernicola]|uniref:TetR/AcrR family transcriptional regulator n=1 Tax=Streptacidiphilus cavernicola TaxID=3342716 RepID=A0ABV6VPU8_9ACTN
MEQDLEHDPEGRAGGGYRRSTGTKRGEARRRDLLDRVIRDVAVNGLVDFSLRRAARAADTTHKVLLYHFDGVDDLLRQVVVELRGRRIDGALAAAQGPEHASLADRVRSMWPVLTSDDSGQLALDQAIGLAMYDADRYGELGRGSSALYLPALLSICPEEWSDRRKQEVASMVLAVLRGFLVHWRTGGSLDGVETGFAALVRALEREQAADEPFADGPSVD